MPVNIRVTPEQKEEIIRLYKEGLSSADIRKRTKLGESTVWRTLKPIKDEEQDATNGGDTKTPKASGTKTQKVSVAGTQYLDEAALIVVSPRRFELSSALFWQAKKVTEVFWKWPVLSEGDWLDTFLYHAMKQRGYILGAVQYVGDDKNGGQDGSV